MDAKQANILAQQFIDALHELEQGSEKHVEGLVALYSDNAKLTNAALKLAGKERRGQDGAREFWTEYRRTFKDICSDFAQITTSEEAAGLFWTAKGTGMGGEAVEYDGVTLLEFDSGGKIKQFRGYYDTRALDKTVSANQR